MSNEANEKVWVLTINHKHGTDIWVRRTQESAWQILVDYATEWWAGEMAGAEMPEEPGDRVSLYFEEVNDAYELEECEVLP
jgi:hypothetical protein